MSDITVSLTIVKREGESTIVMNRQKFTFMGAAQYVMDGAKFYQRKMKFDKDFFEETQYVYILVEYGSGNASEMYIQYDNEKEEVTVQEF